MCIINSYIIAIQASFQIYIYICEFKSYKCGQHKFIIHDMQTNKLVRRGRVTYVVMKVHRSGPAADHRIDGECLRAGTGGAVRNCCGHSHLNGKGSREAGSKGNGGGEGGE